MTGASQEERRTRRRAEFLDAADAAIRANGAGITMADVASAAGVTKPVLYRYVADKQDLVQALALRYARQIEALLAAGTDAGGNPRDMIHRTIDAFLSFIEDEPAIYEFLVRRAPAETPGMAEHLQRFTAQLGDRITVIVASELQSVGKSVVGAAPLAHGMVGMVAAATEWWMSTRSSTDGLSRDALVEHLTAVLWSGFVGLPTTVVASAVPAVGGSLPQPL